MNNPRPEIYVPTSGWVSQEDLGAAIKAIEIAAQVVEAQPTSIRDAIGLPEPTQPKQPNQP
jgi:hypothetical protein